MTPAVAHFVSTINQLLPEPQASLLAGMLFGVRTNMPQDLYEALIITGTLHVVALSGMNVSIIIRLLFDMTGMFLGRIGAVFLTLLGIIGFVWLVGPSPTIVRASIMGSLTVMAVFLGRKDVPLISLFLAAFLMALIDFEVLTSISFQLSFAATLGIILFAGKSRDSEEDYAPKLKDDSIITRKTESEQLTTIPLVEHKQNRRMVAYGVLGALFWADLRVSLSAQLFTIPLIMYYFQRLSLISPIANVLTGWLIAPITYLGFLMVGVAEIWLPLGKLAALVVWVPLTMFVVIVETLAQIPYASLEF